MAGEQDTEVVTVYLRGASAQRFREYLASVRQLAEERGLPYPGKSAVAVVAINRMVGEGDPRQMLLEF